MSSLLMVVAIGLPWVVMVYSPPLNAVVNESMAAIGWGLLIIGLGWRNNSLFQKPATDAYIPVFLLAGLGLMALVHFLGGHIPYPALLFTYWAYLVGAALVFQYGVRLSVDRVSLLKIADVFCVVLLIAAVLNLVYGLYQYWNPVGNYPWIAALTDAGRIYGNTRQPNHYASLMLLGLGSALWLYFERHKLSLYVTVGLSLLLIAGVALSGSRTGIVGVLFVASAVLLLKWGSTTKIRLSIAACLVLTLILFYVMLAALNETGLRPHFGSERLQQLQGDVSGSRFRAWTTSWEMILQNVWTGVGIGRFQFHYLLGEWSQQQGQHFAHAHNLFLHLAAENGLIFATGFLVALFYYGFKYIKISWHASETKLVIVFIGPLLIHSFFEFPFWYTFFLFPTFFLMGILSGISAQTDKGPEIAPRGRLLAIGGLFMVLFSVVFMWSQRSGAAMYEKTDKTPIAERVILAQNSFLLRHYADHALLVTSPPEIAYSKQTTPIYSAVAQVLFDQQLAYHWTLQSLANGNLEQAKRLSYAIYFMSPELFEELKKTVQRAVEVETVGARELADYLNNPVPVNYKLEQFLSAQ